MLKAAEGRFSGLPKSKRKAFARKLVDIHVAKIRKDVREGKAYVEAE